MATEETNSTESPAANRPGSESAASVRDPGNQTIWATGRRKTAVAQVRMVPSSDGGKVTVNGKSVDDYFKGNRRHAMDAMEAFRAVKSFSGYDFIIRVSGGGLTGQAGSIRHGIARAVSRTSETIRIQMRKEGYLTRDPRAVERKKSGQPKARKRFQYSKR